jgi:two-component system cell cycle response regulator CpdR
LTPASAVPSSAPAPREWRGDRFLSTPAAKTFAARNHCAPDRVRFHSFFTHPPHGGAKREALKMNDQTDSAKILLAEDDNDMRRFLVNALKNAGYEVASFDNGLSAYNRLREEPFELLLTDIVMPEMDGIELARRATELDPDIKVMFITGFAAVALNPDNNAPREAKILSKPFHLKDLVNEVQRLLAA